jgi:hypothetical protein
MADVLAGSRSSHRIFLALIVCACAIPSPAAQQTTTSKSKPSKATTAKTTKSNGATQSSSKHHPASKSTHASSARTTTHHGSRHSTRKKTSRARGQQKIDAERATSIQEALIREHYLSGEPTGTWNQDSEDAMRRYQSDHGWQTKEVPDSRALIKLGLGPSNDHLLNPESAMTTGPDAPRSHSAAPTSSSPSPVSPDPAQPGQGDPPSPQ